MDTLGVGIQDYAAGGPHNDTLFDGLDSQQKLMEFQKALEAGSITGSDSRDSSVAGQGAGLKVESLEKNLKLITHRRQDIRLWKAIPKSPAYNTVEEYNQLVDYGADRGGFYNEGELPSTEDSTYVRRAELVKFLGVVKEVTHPMQLVQTHIGSVVLQEIQNGTMWLLRKVDRSLAFGDSSIVDQEFNGLYKQHAAIGAGFSFSTLAEYFDSDSVVDLRGASLKQEDIEDASEAILEFFGYSTHLFAPPKVLKEFAKDYFLRQRLLLDSKSEYSSVGKPPKDVTTTAGNVVLEHDIFLRAAGSRLVASGATATRSPGDPVAGAVPAPVADAAFTKFGDIDGDYFYAVAAINRFGQSDLISLGAALTAVAVTESVDLDFADGGGAEPASGYVIYRSEVNPAGAIGVTPMFPIFQVSTSELATGYDGSAATLIRDRGRYIANTDQAFVIQMNDEVLDFKQLAPLMKMDLAILAPSTRFMILLYGTPRLFANRKMVRFVNAGPFVSP